MPFPVAAAIRIRRTSSGVCRPGIPRPRISEFAMLEVRPIPDRRLVADLSVEHRVNLLASEPLGDENVDQAGHADFASRLLHDRDYLGASQARAADQTGRLSAIETTHRYRRLQLRFWFPSVCKPIRNHRAAAIDNSPNKQTKRPLALMAARARFSSDVTPERQVRASQVSGKAANPSEGLGSRLTASQRKRYLGFENHSQLSLNSLVSDSATVQQKQRNAARNVISPCA